MRMNEYESQENPPNSLALIQEDFNFRNQEKKLNRLRLSNPRATVNLD